MLEHQVEPRKHFQIEKLEDRIAPTGCWNPCQNPCDSGGLNVGVDVDADIRLKHLCISVDADVDIGFGKGGCDGPKR
jgi:hypothetical protein